MSKIYEALTNAANPVASMIQEEQRRQLHVAMAEEEERVTLPPPEPVEARPEPPKPAAPSRNHYRTVSLRAGASSPVLPFDGVDSRTAERYRILRTNVLRGAANARVVGLSSAGPGDGKTTTSINLAGALALKQDLAVLLVDADLRRRTVAKMLGIPGDPGVTDVLTGRCSLEQAIVKTANLPNLLVLPAGTPAPNPAELLDSKAWATLIAEIRSRFAITIVDTTPIGAVADFALVENACDQIIVVARQDHTDRKACLAALNAVNPEKLMGVVLNCVEDWFLWRSHDYYHKY